MAAPPDEADLFPVGALAPATFKTLLNEFYSYVYGLLGATGDPSEALAALQAVGISGNETLLGMKTVIGLNGGQIAGERNKAVNGDMRIAQLGATFAAVANGAYTIDMWESSYVTTAVATVTQNSDAPSGGEFQFSHRTTVTTADTSIATGDFFLTSYKGEGYDFRDLVGRDFTVSFWVRSSLTGVHCVSLRNSGNDRSYVAEYTVLAANTWEFKTVTVPGGLITAGTWDWTTGVGVNVAFALAAGATFQTTADAWQTGNYFATSAQVNCLGTIGNIFAITGFQIECGTEATEFEHRGFASELARVHRYRRAILHTTARPGLRVRTYASAGSQIFSLSGVFGAPMRAVPDATIVGTWAATNCGQPTVGAVSENGYDLAVTSTAGGLIDSYPDASGEGVIFDAGL